MERKYVVQRYMAGSVHFIGRFVGLMDASWLSATPQIGQR
jgi:hypothetical protein